MNILLVEDDQLMVTCWVSGFRDFGHNALGATTGKRARDIINIYQNSIDILILDHLLPDDNGLEIASYVLQKYPDVTPTIVSQDPHLPSIMKKRKIEIPRFGKPIPYVNLLEKLSRIVRLRKFLKNIAPKPDLSKFAPLGNDNGLRTTQKILEREPSLFEEFATNPKDLENHIIKLLTQINS